MKRKIDGLHVPVMPATEATDLDWSKSVSVTLPNLKLSTETISLRVPVSLLHKIKKEANRMDMPYQSLIKATLSDRFFRPVH